MPKPYENYILASKYELETLINILIDKNVITKDEFMQMFKARLENTLLSESEKLDIISAIDIC